MPKQRKQLNRKLPARWRFKHGAYFYRVPPGFEDQWDGKKEFRLGKTLTEAYRTWSERLGSLDKARNIGQLLDRYALEVVPTKAWKTQESNMISIARLRPVFGHVPLHPPLKPTYAYEYMDKVSKMHGNAGANRDFEVLSHAFSKAVEWGFIDRNPVKGQVRKLPVKRRERYVEDWEIAEVLKIAKPMEKAYIALKILTGLRRSDVLRLEMKDLKEDGIHVHPHKTLNSSGVRITIEWTEELREAVEAAKQARPKAPDIAPWLFCTRKGTPYINLETGQANGFDSIWRRLMQKALAETNLKERFQEKDLRKKTATDMDLELASRLLGHTSLDTTRKHYRLKGDVVKPHSTKK